MADYESHLDKLRDKDIRVIAASVDNEENARKMIDSQNLSFQVASGLDLNHTVDILGGFYEKEKGYLQPANFIISPEGKVYLAVYSTGAVGRLHAPEALDAVE